MAVRTVDFEVPRVHTDGSEKSHYLWRQARREQRARARQHLRHPRMRPRFRVTSSWFIARPSTIIECVSNSRDHTLAWRVISALTIATSRNGAVQLSTAAPQWLLAQCSHGGQHAARTVIAVAPFGIGCEHAKPGHLIERHLRARRGLDGKAAKTSLCAPFGWPSTTVSTPAPVRSPAATPAPASRLRRGCRKRLLVLVCLKPFPTPTRSSTSLLSR